MADHANDFLNAGLTQAQAVVLGEKFGSLERRMDGLELRMGRLEDRMKGLEDKMFWLILSIPSLFIAQTAVMVWVAYYIASSMTGQG